MVRDTSGYYRIHAQNTTAKRVLLLNTSNQVVLSDDCSSERALWRIKDEGSGRYSFINKANEGTYAYAMSNMGSGSSGAQIKGESYTNATRLRWWLKPKVSGLQINPSNLSVDVESTLQLSVIKSPSNAIGSTVNWSSNDINIATVSSNGLVTGVSPGTVTITATCDGVSTSKTVTVNRHSDPFHPTNIEYVRIKNWLSRKTVDGISYTDCVMTTVATKSYLNNLQYFTTYIEDEEDSITTFQRCV